MNEINESDILLVVLDPTAESQPALERATMLAAKTGSRLHLLISVTDPVIQLGAAAQTVALDEYKASAGAAMRENLEAYAQDPRLAGIAVDTEIVWHESLARSVSDCANRIDASVIFKDTHYHSAVSRALHTNSDWQLIRESAMPLWLVKPESPFEEHVRIVVCVDPLQSHSKPESLDDTLIDLAASIAKSTDARVDLLHAYQPLVELGNAAKWAINPKRLPLEKLAAQIKQEHELAFNELCDKHDIPVENRHLAAGAIRSVLPGKVTELNASLVVLGSVSSKNFRRLLIGATAEIIMDHTPCDLLIARPE